MTGILVFSLGGTEILHNDCCLWSNCNADVFLFSIGSSEDQLAYRDNAHASRGGDDAAASMPSYHSNDSGGMSNGPVTTALYDTSNGPTHRTVSDFRPSATKSGGLMESASSLLLSSLSWRTPPGWLTDAPWLATPPHVTDGWGARPLR